MADITLLDGGLGQELINRSGDAPTPLWATRVMIDHPGLVQAIHADYFAAGATIATLNSYAIHHDRLLGFGLDHEFEALHARAAAEAKAARDAHGAGRLAASLGPLIASYRADVDLPVDEAASRFAEIARLLAPHVDLMLIETQSTLTQVEGALKGLTGIDKPVWLSITVGDRDGSRLRSGQPIAALEPLIETYRPAAVLANCSAPEAMPAALAELSRFGLPFGAYANGFATITEDFLKDQPTVDALAHRHDITPERYADFAMDWVEAGATIIGGCCEVGPAHIRALAARLRAAGHRIV